MSFRCPKTKHSVSLEICQGRKDRKQHGCVTCSYPKQVAKDQARMADLRVRLVLEPKTTAQRNNPIEIRGLGGPPIAMSRLVARDLLEKLQAALHNGL